MVAKKPEPRRSALSAEHPYAPPIEAHQPEKYAQPPETTQERLAGPTVRSPIAPPHEGPKSPEKRPMSVRVTLEDQARIRATFLATNSAERHGSLSDFITRATLKQVLALETQYNAGKPWPAVDPGEVPTGRPIA